MGSGSGNLSMPRPAKIDKTCGTQRGKANFVFEEEKKGKLIIKPCVKLVMIILFAERPFKSNVFLHQSTMRHYKSLNNNLRTFVKFLDRLVYALFAPPRGFNPAFII